MEPVLSQPFGPMVFPCEAGVLSAVLSFRNVHLIGYWYTMQTQRALKSFASCHAVSLYDHKPYE
jgi:hypothetical protein